MIWRKHNKWAAFKLVVDVMFKYFCIIVTMLLIITGIMAWLEGSDWLLHSQDLLRYLLLAFAAVLPILLEAFFEVKTLLVLRAVHIALIVISVTTVLLLFGEPDQGITIRTGIIFLVIFASVYGYSYLQNRELAKKVNRQLDALHREENATHRD